MTFKSKNKRFFAVEQQPNHKPVSSEKVSIWESDFSNAADWAIAHDAADCSLDFKSVRYLVRVHILSLISIQLQLQMVGQLLTRITTEELQEEMKWKIHG